MKLKEQLWKRIRAQGKSIQTAKTYWGWFERYLRFVKERDGRWRHPKELGRDDVQAWLSSLANEHWVSPNTQNVALQSALYVYREVLGKPIQGVNALRAKAPQRVRDVLDVEEVSALFDELDGLELLVAQLMYGCGLRIGDVVGLRIKDVSFSRKQLHIWDGKGYKDRVTQFPEVLHERMKEQMEVMRAQWQRDRHEGRNGVSLPFAWGRKSPSSHLDYAWWYVFASDKYSRSPENGKWLRHHRDRSHLSRKISQASKRAGIGKRITSHNLRHSFATHSSEQGIPVATLAKLLGHSSIQTTETYLHVSKDGATASKSPLEHLLRHPPRTTRNLARKTG